jgi:hypothetical protein
MRAQIFFHVNATVRHRVNSIPILEDDQGNPFSRHEDKAQLLWEAYKDRLGTSEFSTMLFDLHSLLRAPENLQWLEDPFSKEEIDNIIKELPAEKSLGPDGFNSDFIKKCWPTISQEFYDLCHGFCEGNICMQSINGSNIVLVPKKDNPLRVGDFRSISLLNFSMKILTKLLANRLQKVILKLIHRNQYGFIKERSIQDCLAWAFEYLFLCKQTKREMVIPKLDFEKVFDKVEHEVIL